MLNINTESRVELINLIYLCYFVLKAEEDRLLEGIDKNNNNGYSKEASSTDGEHVPPSDKQLERLQQKYKIAESKSQIRKQEETDS